MHKTNFIEDGYSDIVSHLRQQIFTVSLDLYCNVLLLRAQ